jgi:hypothetical protein
MSFFEGKEILTKLQKGLETNKAATFIKRDEEQILSLIAKDLVKPTAFMNVNKVRFGSQNLTETTPVTNKGKEMFGLS